MRRLPPRRIRQGALVLAVAATALLLLLPMRLALGWAALGERGITARSVRGSVWSGVIEQMHVGALPLGTVHAALSPLPLVLGRVRMTLDRPGTGGSDDLRGTLTMGRDSIAIDHLSGPITTAGLFAPLPIATLELDEVGISFIGNRCAQAEGRVRARLSGALPGLALSQGLSGRVTCDGQQARVSLAGQSGQERIDLGIDARGGYVADALIAEPDPLLAPILADAGFLRVPGGYRLRVSGQPE